MGERGEKKRAMLVFEGKLLVKVHYLLKRLTQIVNKKVVKRLHRSILRIRAFLSFAFFSYFLKKFVFFFTFGVGMYTFVVHNHFFLIFGFRL